MPHGKAHNAQKYSIIEKMAAGSFGVVFKIKCLSNNSTMVMKRIPLEDLDREQCHEAAKELSLISELHHPYIVSQRDAFLFDDNDLCLVMDYYDGGDLDYLLARQRDKDEYFDFEQVMLWFVQMLLALDYLHAHGIVHRDVKTHNLFLDQASNTIAVGDFGIAEKVDFSSPKKDAGAVTGSTTALPSSVLATAGKSQWREGGAPFSNRIVGHPHSGLPPPTNSSEGVDGPHLSSSSDNHLQETDIASPNHEHVPDSPPRVIRSPTKIAVKGTPLYMPPEALQGMPYGPNSDVWSLGCILYELLSLRHPFDSTDIGGLIMRIMLGDRGPLPAHYPHAVSELINATLTLECAKRPSCEELLRTPLVSTYASRFLELRKQANSRNAKSASRGSAKQKYPLVKAPAGFQDAREEEDAFQRQLRRVYGSPGANSLLSKEGPNALMSYLEYAKQLKKPLNPPSYDCELAHRGRRASAMLIQLTSAFTTDGLGNHDTTTPGTLPTVNTLLSLELSPNAGSVDPSPAGIRQRTMSNNNSEDDEDHQMANAGGSLNFDAADAEDGPDRAHLGLHAREHQNAESLSKLSFFGLSIDRSNVEDMRNQPLSVLAAEVLRARALLQNALFERQRRKNAERLLLDVGPHLVVTMPQTFKGVTTPASDSTATKKVPPPLRRTTEESRQKEVPPVLSLGCAGPGKLDSSGAREHPEEMPREVSFATRVHGSVDAKLQVYLDRRATLLQSILEEVSANVLSRVYAYYREHNIFVRDPGVVLSLVPERKQWRVLPFIEDIVVLDKFIEKSTNNNDKASSTRTVSSGQVSF
ncbi:unnamed protein product [Phytomonas sp. Hart1]|nr:unnamed protein product [Phytomonas sp. Hart1]|eukprot:CCW72103.1 unnamed protein product [Phytomonas sp. isolate Hart1]